MFGCSESVYVFQDGCGARKDLFIITKLKFECLMSEETKMEDSEGKEESKKDESNDKQMYSALSFWVMLLFVGFPLWWKTTEVYRVSLPYSEIDSLYNLSVQIQMNIHIVTIEESHGMFLTGELNNLFKMSKLFKIVWKLHSVDKAIIGSCKSLEEIEEKIKHPHFEGSLQLFETPGLSRFTPDNIVLGRNRTVYFSSGTDAVKLFSFLRAEILKEDFLLKLLSQAVTPMKTDLNLRHKVPPSDEFDILFTILNPEPEFLDVRFDISEAIDEYIRPFLRNLEDMNKFHVKSQWLYFVTLQVQPKFLNTTDRGPHFALSEDLLPHIITPLEKKLASHVSKHPCLNFILFVAPCSMTPLKVYTRQGFPVDGPNAFISSRWGGVQMHNPDREACLGGSKAIVEPDKHSVMTVFIRQLRLLLGISSSDGFERRSELSSGHVRLWEKDALLRLRAVEQLASAKLTLQSLSKLLGKISNIVINDHVGEAIYSALGNIHDTAGALASGKLVEAYGKSKSAFLSSESAFTDPSLLALLYFPDDQKYAVYIPLFLPILIPILISFKHIKQWAKKKFNQSEKSKVD